MEGLREHQIHEAKIARAEIARAEMSGDETQWRASVSRQRSRMERVLGCDILELDDTPENPTVIADLRGQVWKANTYSPEQGGLGFEPRLNV